MIWALFSLFRLARKPSAGVDSSDQQQCGVQPEWRGIDAVGGGADRFTHEMELHRD